MPIYNTNLCPMKKNSFIRGGEWVHALKPRLIGSFSVAGEDFVDSLQNMRYLSLPQTEVNWDLNVGFEAYSDTKMTTRGRIERILKYIERYPDKVTLSGDVPDKGNKIIFPDFVCSRGFLATLMKTPYPKKESRSRLMAAYPQRNKPAGWKVLATKFRGTIYLWWNDDRREEGSDGGHREDMRPLYFGYKYRQMITTQQLNKPSSIDEPVVRQKFSGVFNTKFGDHRVLYAGEIFGIDSKKILTKKDLSKSNVKIIQMHTKMNNMKPENFLKNKLLHWWSKTSLIGAETVYAGVRTFEGVLQRIEPIEVRNIPRMARRHWSDKVCIKFCIAFLDMVKETMKHVDDPDKFYKFTYDPAGSDKVQYEIFPGKTDLFVLPSWYIEFLDELAASGPPVKEGE